MLKTIIAHSTDIDTDGAIDEIIEQCNEELGDLKPQAGLLFTGPSRSV